MAAILAFLSQSWIGQLFSLAINWWTTRQENIRSAENAESQAVADHQNDGAQSVIDRDSADQQNSALDKIAKDLDNPLPAQVIKPEGDKP